MYCDIKNTNYGKDLAAKIGNKNAKKFGMSIATKKFKLWFGNGKTQTLENNFKAPFINPLMQIINEKGERFSIIEKYKFGSVEDVNKFLSSVNGITNKDGVFTIQQGTEQFTVQKLVEELHRIYPKLINQQENTFVINESFFNNEEAGILTSAAALVDGIKGMYQNIAKSNLKGVMFEAAQQAVSSDVERREAERIFGKEFVELSLKLYPDVRPPGEAQKESSLYQSPEYSVETLLDSLSERFNIPYRTINDPNLNVRGYYDVDGTVVINLAKVSADTPFHEFLHPFMILLERDNPALYNTLLGELRVQEMGQAIIREVKRNYKELSQKEQMHEAIVTYIGRLAATRYKEKKAAKASPIARLMRWIETQLKKINIRFKDLWLNTKLSDIADMMVDDVFYANLKRARKINKTVRELRVDTDLTHETLFNRIKDRINILSATLSTRKEGGQFIEDINELKAIFEVEDEFTSINNFMVNALTYVSQAKDRFEQLRDSVKDPSKLSKDMLSYHMHVLAEIQQLLNVYESLDDVKTLYRRDMATVSSDVMSKLTEAIDKKNDVIQDFKSFALTYLTEWLYPYIEPTNKRLLAKGHEDKVLTKEGFRNQLEAALSDISAPGFWLGTVINSQDPISAAIALALKDVVYEDHVENLKVKEELEAEYSKVKGTRLFASSANEEEFNLQFLREVDNWEVTGINAATGKPIFGWVKRLAFHTEYDTAAFEKAKQDMKEELGPRPTKGTPAYNAYAAKRNQWFKDNTRLDPDAVNIIAHKKATMSKRAFDKWIQANTVELEDEPYEDGSSKSNRYYSGRIYSYSSKRGTFRIFAGELVKPTEKWKNRNFDRMMANPYYKSLYTAYKEANEKLHPSRRLRHGIIPQVSKGGNLFSDVARTNSIKDNVKGVWSKFKDSLRPSENDAVGVQRQDGSEVKRIPVEYVRMLESSDLSVNLLESVLKFYQMANNFESMSEIEPNILILKTILNGDNNLGIKGREVISTAASGKGRLNAITKKLVPKAAQEDKVNKRLNEFIDDVVYGDEEAQDTFHIFGFEGSWNKVGAKVGLLTSITMMGLNFTAGINNVIIGNYQNSIESVGGRYWGKKDWLWAHKEYFANMHEFLGEIAGTTKSPINHLADHYSVPQGEFQNEFGQNIAGGLVNKAFKTSSLFFLQKGGEHELQITGMLSLMHNTMVKDKSGKELNLFEAWKIAGNDAAKMEELFGWTASDDKAFRNTLHAITKNLHGVYNKFDKATLQRKWYGKLALMFRKYLFSSIKARYGSEYVDYELGNVQQGYWNTFFKKVYKDYRDYKWQVFSKLFSKDGYNEMEKAAAKKTMYEMGVMITAFVLGLMIAGGEDDDDDKTWLDSQLELMIVRFGAESRQFLNPTDFLRIIRNPAASANLMEKHLAIMWQLVTAPTETYDRDTGQFEKGDSKLLAKMIKASPIFGQVIRVLSPEEQISFYNLTGGGKHK